jgi:hypothetical protein
MCDYLDQHPEIYVSYAKEPHFFGSDLNIRRTIRDLDAYSGLFNKGEGRLCGEGSTWYLYSRKAAQEIYAFNPNARIIIMVRNPVDFMYSLHNQNVFTGDEVIEDFAEALQAEEARKQRENIPSHCIYQDALRYTEAARFTDQIRRYFEVFGRENVHVIVFDDFIQDVARVYAGVLGFLGVCPDFQADLKVANPSKYIRNPSVRSFIRSDYVRVVARTLLPHPVRIKLYRMVDSANTRYQQRPPMDPALRRRLQEQFAPEVARLGTLLERDLSHWSTSER